MSLVWCMIALVMSGTDDPTPTHALALGFPCIFGTPFDCAKEIWALKLETAIRIGLNNSEILRVINFGPDGVPVGNCFGEADKSHQSPPTMEVDLANGYTPENSSIVITPIESDVNICRFKSEVMAHVRSVEQQYWNLAQARAALCGAEQAVRIAREVIKNEQDEVVLCRAGCPDLAEATQRLEQFQQEVAKRKPDVADNERRLRFLLGLPVADNRQIVPVTPPINQHVVFDRETCLDELIMRSQAAQKQVVDQAKQTLARIYPQVESGYQEYMTARRARVADYHKLRSKQNYYNEGRITADRYLDAVARFVAAVATEHQCLATYNIMMAALAECKGTLLTERDIIVAPPRRRTDAKQVAGRVKDDEARQASFVGPMPATDDVAELPR